MKINNKNQFLTLLNQARYYRKNNSFEESVGFYKSALDIDKYAWDTHYELATYYCINQQAKKSLAHFKILISKFPSNVNVCKDFALALSDSSEYQDAIKYFKKTLNLEPKLIDLYVPFAETLRRDRRYLEAIKTLKHVLTVTPQNHTALVTLGLVYRDTEENSKALECLEKASDLAPEQPFYRLQYANLLYKVGLLKLAEIQVKAAINLQENFFDADILYIKILEADYRYKEALDVLEGVLQKNSLNLELFIKKAELYQEINMIDNALIIYDKLLNESPTYLNAILGKFNILLQQGNDNKAKELIEKYINVDPKNLDMHILIFFVKKYPLLHPMVKKLINSLDGIKHNKVTAIESLAKVMEYNNQWGKAFEYYKKAKEEYQKQNFKKYNPEKIEEFTNSIIRTFDENLLNELKNYSCDEDTPIIIVGMPRSGKSLTAELLSLNKDIKNLDEINYWVRACDMYDGSKTIEYPNSLRHIKNNNAKQLLKGYLDLTSPILSESKKTKFIDTFPYNFHVLGLIAALIPNATILHTTRDFMDLCIHIYIKNFKYGHEYTTSLTDIKHFYDQYLRLMSHWGKLFPGKIHEIKFENVVHGPKDEYSKILRLVGMKNAENMLDYSRIAEFETKVNKYKKSIGYWKNFENKMIELKSCNT